MTEGTAQLALLKQFLRCAIGLATVTGCGPTFDDTEDGDEVSTDGPTCVAEEAPFDCAAWSTDCFTLEYICVTLEDAAIGDPDDPNCGSCGNPECARALRDASSIGTVDWIACGPHRTIEDECCYLAHMHYPAGRPFVVAGVGRMAPTRDRHDWMIRSQPDVSELADAERAALAQAWREDARAEHASIASFARFVLQLLAIGAPDALVAEAQRALADEIDHARLCFGMARAYDRRAIGPDCLEIDHALQADTNATEIVVAAVIEGCVGETLAALQAAHAADCAADPEVERVLRRISEDEARHAALAWRFVRWALDQHDDDLGDAVEAAFATARPPQSERRDRIEASVLLRHGRLPAACQADLMGRGLQQVVIATAAEMLATHRGAEHPRESSLLPAT